MKQNKALTIAGWVLTILVSALLLFSATATKFAPSKEAIEGFAKSGFPDGTLIPIGVAETVSTLLFLIPQTRVLGAVLLTGYMGGAIAIHVRMGEVFIIQAAIGVVVWLALFLRDPRIRALLPIVTSSPAESVK